jgi:hypothetical protein
MEHRIWVHVPTAVRRLKDVSAEMTVTYPAASTATAEAVHLSAPSTGRSSAFFDGHIRHVVPAARALLVVAEVAASRFHTPASMIAARIRAADPVVTAEPDRLRFESFSQCGGVHARLDLVEDGLDVVACAPGTTNVDFNEPLRSALSEIARHEPLRLVVGWDELTVQTFGGTVVERRVPLPERWVKGFGEVQVTLAGKALVMELDRVRAQRFISALPGGSTTAWAEPTRSGVRIGHGRRPGAVCLAGSSRLRVLQPLARFATGLRAYADPDTREPTAVCWALGIPGGRVALTLSPEVPRGFSGEGGLLFDLVDAGAHRDAEVLRRALAGHTRFSMATVSQATSIEPGRARAALTWLGVHGHLGFDPADGMNFWRHLPYPDDLLRSEPQRLRDARSLVAAGAATPEPGGSWRVISGGAEYRSTVGRDAFSCTCPWGSRHGRSRGPCKHVVAAAIVDAQR